ncbi:MAG: hypothetical protein OHK005_20320 [Candidatus Methylacidiphilales bacterium]
MKWLPLWTGLVVGLSVTLTWASGPDPSPLQERLLIVYNRNDPDSESLARYYAERRNIPEERILGIECPVTETVSREEFNRTIRKPIRDYLEKKGWMKWTPRMLDGKPVLMARNNQIWAMALIRGIPLKIAEDSSEPLPENVPPPLRTNAAAVDSELALITFENLPITGLIGNLYYSNDSSPQPSGTPENVRPFSQQFADFLILVCRLDAPEPEHVRRMIDEALAVEQMELTGRAYVDTRGITRKEDAYILGDEWLRRTADLFRASGFETVVDEDPGVVPPFEPWADVALYAGWYSEHLHGPFDPPGFRFRPGAVAYHIHSFSANSLRTTEKNWAGPFLARGVAATMGAVYEPYLRFTPEVPTFFAALLNGLTFAEAAYQSQIALSWMITNVGDPLYRPFPRNFYLNLENARATQHPDLPWLRLRNARLTYNSGKIGETNRTLRDLLDHDSSPLLREGYADIMTTFAPDRIEAWKTYQDLIQTSRDPFTRIRLGIKLARSWEQRGRHADALALYDSLLADHPTEATHYHLPQRAYALVTSERIQNVPERLRPILHRLAEEAASRQAATQPTTPPPQPKAPQPPSPPLPPGPPPPTKLSP